MRCWMAVASADHVRIGQAQRFMQVCHGKAGPLKRLSPGDGVVYYSPAQTIGERTPLRALTAIGTVAPGAPYQVEMAASFHPYRRDVLWWRSHPAPIAPLLDVLELSAGRRNWGYGLRFGLLEVTKSDFDCMALAMSAQAPAQAY